MAYDRAVADDVFIKWPESMLGQIADLNPESIGVNRAMLGKVWPDGRCAFPDFFKESTLTWWEEMIAYTYNNDSIRFDALWIE